MNHITKKAREDYTNALFDALWDGKRVWDALCEMENERHVIPSKVLNCKNKSAWAGWNELKYELDWKETGLKVVVKGSLRPWMGIWDWLFGDAKTRCYNKAVRWLDKASDEEQPILFTVYFLAGDTPITGAERNRELVHKFVEYLDSLQPEVSQKDANFMADVVIQKGA